MKQRSLPSGGARTTYFTHGIERFNAVFDSETISDLVGEFRDGSTRSDSLMRLSRHPILATLARSYLGPDIRLINAMYYAVPPHSPSGLPITDHDVFDIEVGAVATFLIAITDLDTDTATPIIDGTPVRLQPGSVIAVRSDIARRSAPNHSDRTCLLGVFSYFAGTSVPVLRDGYEERVAAMLPPAEHIAVVSNGNLRPQC